MLAPHSLTRIVHVQRENDDRFHLWTDEGHEHFVTKEMLLEWLLHHLEQPMNRDVVERQTPYA